MKKLLSIFIACCLTASLFTGCAGDSEVGKNGTLKIFNWGEYMSDGTDASRNVIREFERETGIKVEAYDTYDSNEQMYAKLKSGSSDYDIIFPSDYMISRLIDEDMVEKIDFDKLENYGNIMDEYKGDVYGYDPTNEYSVPYTWGTVGIVYNKKMVEKLTGQPADEVVKGWSVFWDERFKDNMFMFINSRDSFMIAEKLLGYSLNETDPDRLKQAASKLREQKPYVQAYVMDEMFDKMENGEAALSPAYAGDIITMMDYNEELGYCFPEEGTNIFVDVVAIPKGAKNKENAEKFIDFLCRADIAKANIEYISYSTPNRAAYEKLDEDLRESEIAYPSKERLERCEAFVNLSLEATEQMENLWTEIRK